MTSRKIFPPTASKIFLVVVLFATIFVGGGCLENKGATSDRGAIPVEKIIEPKEKLIITTNKTEYQKGEEVKITVENNLDEEIGVVVGLQVFENGKWETISHDIFCFYSGRECESIKISLRLKEELSWSQKVPWSNENLKGLHRLQVVIWDDDDNTTAMTDFPDIVYSNEFTTKSDLVDVGGLDYCQEDSDCKVDFSRCDCQYHCVNKNIEMEDCAAACDETGPIISECVCENNKCRACFDFAE